MASVAVMVMVNALETICGGELLSVRPIEKLYVFAVTGVPESIPKFESVKPAGKEPD
jgi:hypothetical protein